MNVLKIFENERYELLIDIRENGLPENIKDLKDEYPIINEFFNVNSENFEDELSIVKLESNKNSIYKNKSELDQFYTNELIAKKYYNILCNEINIKKYDLFLEPSAGTGSFYNLLPKTNRIGLDLDPKHDEIIKQDFFDYVPPENKKIITIGNPPFGKNSSLAVKFFNKAAEFSEVIAFIIPKTFQKESLQNRLNLNFKLRYNQDLDKNSFVLNGEPYNVPCCFQIWVKHKKSRTIKKTDLKNSIFIFSKKQDSNIAVRRVGGRAGKATDDIDSSNKNCFYFLKIIDKNISKKELIEKINNIDFSKIVNKTAGVRSLSKPEFIKELFKNK